MDDVGRVDDGGEAGSVQLGGVLVLILWSGRGNRSRQRHTLAQTRDNVRVTIECIDGEGRRSDLTEDVRGVPSPHEVWGVRSQCQHSLALDLQLQRLLVLPLQT